MRAYLYVAISALSLALLAAPPVFAQDAGQQSSSPEEAVSATRIEVDEEAPDAQ